VRAGLATVTWAEAVTSGVAIKASHITEMRTRLGEARTALGLAATSYTDPSLAAGTTIKAPHIQEIRDSLKAAWNTSSQISRDGHASISYDTASNRITTAGFAYDAAGNQVRALTAGGSVSQRFQYDAANRLAKVKADDNTTVLATYTYGNTNERLVAEEGGSRTYYAGEGGTTIAEFTESGASTTPAWSKNYIYLDGRLLSTLVPNGSGGESVEYHHPDRLGTRLVTNPATGTSFEQVTLPFGTALTAESTGATNRRFTSYNRSGTTGLDYAVNRHYDPQQGRFTQVDPIGMQSTSLANPQTLNLYAYCTNDPVNRTDPNGLGFFSFLKKLFKWIAVAFTVAVAVVTIILAPYLAANVLQAVFMIIGAVAGAAAAIANALGFTKLGAILEIISAAATFGASTISAALEKTAKTILKAISDGAALVSKTLTAYGYDKLGQIFDLVSSSTGFVSDSIDEDTGKFKIKKWELYKFVRETTEKIATIAGADELAMILNKAGLIDDIGDIYIGIRDFNKIKVHDREDLGAEVKRFGTVVQASTRIRKLLRLQSRLDTLSGLVEKINSIFERLEKKQETAPAMP
jgi:RHS repeat-associated protein